MSDGGTIAITTTTRTAASKGQLIDQLLFWFLTAGVVGLAVPFAGVELPYKMGFAVYIGILFIVWLATRPFVEDPLPAPFRRLWPSAVLLLLVCLWGYIQTLGLPQGWSHPSWKLAQTASELPLKFSISLNREATVEDLTFLMSLGFLFWLTLQLGRDPRRGRTALQIFVIAVTLNAAYGLISQVLNLEFILWKPKQDYLNSVTGTFVNRNTFAAYVGLALIVASAIVIDEAASSRRSNLPLKLRIAEVLDALFGRNALRLVAIFVLAAALVLTQSRAGSAAFVVGFLFTIAAFTVTEKLKVSFALSFAVLILVPVIVIFLVTGQGLLGRLDVSGEELSAARLPLFERVWSMIQDSWLTGTGLGTFQEAFYPYVDETIFTTRTWFSAHSTYLQLMGELGMVFAGALFLCIFLLAADCWMGLTRRRRYNYFAVIGVGTTALVAFHSTVDFSLQIPAVAVAYTFLLALGVSQSAPTRH